ncbi:MAG TPA: fluoride efflux transporter CrcB [Alphaproteobacteria bacterium]|nr:fluoride efflux transporter CrcB [Alphaproteobacteria bacterium]
MNMVLAIAAGGAIGSAARYGTMIYVARWLGAAFPYGTIAVNILGAFVMGVLIELMALVWSPGEMMRAFLTVGVLGGYTTFSTFSLDSWLLIEHGDYGLAMLYIVSSVVFCIVALIGGAQLTRAVLA